MSEKPKRVRRSFNEEFKRDAVNLIVKQGYSFKAAAEAVNVSTRSLREWHEKYAPEHGRHMDWLRDHGQEPICSSTAFSTFD